MTNSEKLLRNDDTDPPPLFADRVYGLLPVPQFMTVCECNVTLHFAEPTTMYFWLRWWCGKWQQGKARAAGQKGNGS